MPSPDYIPYKDQPVPDWLKEIFKNPPVAPDPFKIQTPQPDKEKVPC